MKLKKEHLRTPESTAALTAFCFGMAVHAFALFNILQNHDNIASQPGGYGIGVVLGRWMLEILGLAASAVGLDYNLPVINGVLYIALLAVTAAAVVFVLRIRSRVSAGLIGALFTGFPTVAATMIYRYTVIYYGIAAILAVMAVWVCHRWRWGFLLSAGMIAVSMGIYQAYVPLTIGLFVMLLIQSALTEEADIRQLLRRGLLDCAALLLGLALYILGLRVCERLFHSALLEYQGVSSMFQISLSQLPGLVWKAFTTVCALPLRDSFGLANRAVMRLLYLILGAAVIGMVLYILTVKVRDLLKAAAVALLLLLFPVAVNFITIMCPDSWIYTLMVYPFTLLCCMPLMLLECMPDQNHRPIVKKLAVNGVALAVAGLVFYYGYYANVNYTALYYANRQIENYVSALVTQVRMTEDFTPEKEWAFLGQIDDPLLQCVWEEDAFYGGLGFTEYLLNQYSMSSWFENYVGYRLPLASEDRCAELAQLQQVQDMPCWPSAGSVAVIDDTVVIKFQEIAG